MNFAGSSGSEPGIQEGFFALLEDVLKDHPDNVKLIGILKGAVKEAGAKSTENR